MKDALDAFYGVLVRRKAQTRKTRGAADGGHMNRKVVVAVALIVLAQLAIANEVFNKCMYDCKEAYAQCLKDRTERDACDLARKNCEDACTGR